MFVPILTAQLGAFIEKLPGYVSRLQTLATDPSRPWLRKIVGEGVGDAQVGDLVKQGAGWVTAFLESLWSGGQALISIFSLLVITPVVAFYLLYDWDRMVATVDNWVPLQHRETVRGLAREIDDAIAGFVRGQTAVCLILGSFYAVALTLTGLNFGLLIGLRLGHDHLHSLCRLDDRACARRRRRDRAVLARMTRRSSSCSASSSSASSSKATCWRRSWSAKASGCIRSG